MPRVVLVNTGALAPSHTLQHPDVVDAGQKWHDVLMSLSMHTQYHGTALACVANGDGENFCRWVEHRATAVQAGTYYHEQIRRKSEIAIREQYSNLVHIKEQPPILASLICHGRQRPIELDETMFAMPFSSRYVEELQCPIVNCNYLIKSKEDALEHARFHKTIGEWKCPACQQNATGIIDLWVHVSEKHKNLGTLRCPYCNGSFKTKEYLTTHIKRVHDQESKELFKDETPINLKTMLD